MNAIGYGLVGAGAFGVFCLDAYLKSPHVRIVGIADNKPEVARNIAAHFNMRHADSVDELIADPAVEIVHLATPPSTHKELALKCLAAGKHVLCEKPLALTVADGEAMLAAARDAGRVLAVNLIMRYDPLNIAIGQIIRQKLLGEPIFASLHNLAGDEKLHLSHWFWDKRRSGGIFIEHGVHFFDLMTMWFGRPARVASAEQIFRPNPKTAFPIVDQVRCTVMHGGPLTAAASATDELNAGALAGGGGSRGDENADDDRKNPALAAPVMADYYHGFHQPGRLDRQELRIVCERGDIRLFEWLATDATIHGLFTPESLARVQELLPRVTDVQSRPIESHVRPIQARHHNLILDTDTTLAAGVGMGKLDLYQQVIRELLEDQIAYIRDPAHKRNVTESNGLESLRIACTAETMATRKP